MKHFIFTLALLALVFAASQAPAQDVIIGKGKPAPVAPAEPPATGGGGGGPIIFPQGSYITIGPNLADRRYHTCQSSTDCVAVNPGCGASVVAINRDYQAEVQGWYDQARPNFACRLQGTNSSYVPVCNAAQQCAMAMPGSMGMPRPNSPNYCDADADCTIVTDACGRKTAVNTGSAASIPLVTDATTCSYTDTTVLQGLACENHQCRAHLSNQ